MLPKLAVMDALENSPLWRGLPTTTREVFRALWKSGNAPEQDDALGVVVRRAFPLQETLAHRVGVDVGTIRRHIKRLKNAGLVIAERENARRWDQRNYYTLLIPPDVVAEARTRAATRAPAAGGTSSDGGDGTNGAEARAPKRAQAPASLTKSPSLTKSQDSTTTTTTGDQDDDGHGGGGGDGLSGGEGDRRAELLKALRDAGVWPERAELAADELLTRGDGPELVRYTARTIHGEDVANPAAVLLHRLKPGNVDRAAFDQWCEDERERREWERERAERERLERERDDESRRLIEAAADDEIEPARRAELLSYRFEDEKGRRCRAEWAAWLVEGRRHRAAAERVAGALAAMDAGDARLVLEALGDAAGAVRWLTVEVVEASGDDELRATLKGRAEVARGGRGAMNQAKADAARAAVAKVEAAVKAMDAGDVALVRSAWCNAREVMRAIPPAQILSWSADELASELRTRAARLRGAATPATPKPTRTKPTRTKPKPASPREAERMARDAKTDWTGYRAAEKAKAATKPDPAAWERRVSLVRMLVPEADAGAVAAAFPTDQDAASALGEPRGRTDAELRDELVKLAVAKGAATPA